MFDKFLAIGGGVLPRKEARHWVKSCLRDLLERRSEALRGGDPRG